METKKAIINILDKQYELKFTIGFWKKIKEVCEVTSANMQQKLEEDFGNVCSQIIYYGCYYANKENCPTLEDIENNLDRSVCDAIEQALINGMTKAERQLVEIAQKRRDKQVQELIDEDNVKEDPSEKK